MEKRNSGALSPKESWQLSMHLKICKWCKAYEKKLKILDEILKRTLIQEEKNKIDTTDIQNFKDEMIRKMDF
ncbi:hypothetical protein [Chryseobacterium piperi]|nr:hypothetical protein [Chryseobacterium piperi]